MDARTKAALEEKIERLRTELERKVISGSHPQITTGQLLNSSGPTAPPMTPFLNWHTSQRCLPETIEEQVANYAAYLVGLATEIRAHLKLLEK